MKIIGIILLIFILFIIPYKIMMSLKKEKKAEIVITCTFWLLIPFASWGCYLININRKRKQEIEKLVKNLNDDAVSGFINYIDEWGCFNHPTAWAELKGALRIVNESDKVTSEKKTQLRNSLMLNGLKLHGSEMNIINK